MVAKPIARAATGRVRGVFIKDWGAQTVHLWVESEVEARRGVYIEPISSD